MTYRSTINLLLSLALWLWAACVLFACVLVACDYLKPACQVIDVANQACAVVKYLDKDGNVHTVTLDNQTMRTLARDGGPNADP